MGVVNLSSDSTYKDSIAYSSESAVRKARTLAAQGADIIDLGSESTTAKAARVDADRQIESLVPVIEQLTADGITVSTESYEPKVVQAAMEAGSRVLNMTGVEHERGMLELAAEYQATVVMCFAAGTNVREIRDVSTGAQALPELLEHFEPRLESARIAGVDNVVIDPGMGFYYGNLTDPPARVAHQSSVLLNSFRLRSLGVPICNSLPTAYAVFEDDYRNGEPFFAVLALLGGTDLIRTHEVAKVRSVCTAMSVAQVLS
jgi:dihydropteroate synthase